ALPISARERGRQMHGGRLIVCADGAAAPARRRPQTRRAGAHVLGEDPLRADIARMQAGRRSCEIERPGQNRLMARYRRYAEALRPLCHQQVADQRPGRRQQTSRWRVRRVLQALVAAVYADQQLDPVVIRRDVLVSYGPIEPQPVATVGLEVVGTVAQGDSSPVIRATTQHARAPPIEATGRLVARAHIGLAGYLPAAVHGGVVEAKGLLRRADARERRLVRCLEHGRLGCGVVPASRLEHEYLRAVHAQRIGGLSAGGSGADHDDIVVVLLRFRLHEGHDASAAAPLGQERYAWRPMPCTGIPWAASTSCCRAYIAAAASSIARVKASDPARIGASRALSCTRALGYS